MYGRFFAPDSRALGRLIAVYSLIASQKATRANRTGGFLLVRIAWSQGEETERLQSPIHRDTFFDHITLFA